MPRYMIYRHELEHLWNTEPIEGVCVNCGNLQVGCPLEGHHIMCGDCGKRTIYGLGEILLRGWYQEER